MQDFLSKNHCNCIPNAVQSQKTEVGLSVHMSNFHGLLAGAGGSLFYFLHHNQFFDVIGKTSDNNFKKL